MYQFFRRSQSGWRIERFSLGSSVKETYKSVIVCLVDHEIIFLGWRNEHSHRDLRKVTSFAA